MQDPEIVDSMQDVELMLGVSTTVMAPEIDLVASWFESNATTVSVFWQVVDFSHRLQPDETYTFYMTCTSGDHVMSIDAGYDPYAAGWIAGVDVVGPHGTGHPIPVPASASGNVIRLDAPRSLFPASSCTSPRAQADLLLRMGNGWSTMCCIFWWRDFAPDQGHGRDVVFS